MDLPTLIVTGASGFIGRHLLERIKERYRVFGIARRSQTRSGAPIHPNIRWFQIDIADREPLRRAFEEACSGGPVQTVVHLAAHYDFTGREDPEYQRTNVVGLRNVLDCCQESGIKHVIFSSSLAACPFPLPGETIDETTPPTGKHIYARTKAEGERMVEEYRSSFSTVIVRFAALFSDWCEYPPLFKFLETWLSERWNSRILAGRGGSAIPYLHVLDATEFLEAVLTRINEFHPSEILCCSRDGSISHLDLYQAATRYYFETGRPTRHVPRLLVRPGIHLRCLLGRLQGEMPFERPWMADYIDQRLDVDASRSRARLGWEPRERREILRRLPFLLEHLKTEPIEWIRLNHAAMKRYRVRPNLQLHSLLGAHAEVISSRYTESLQEKAAQGELPSYANIDSSEHEWNHRLILRHLMNSILTQERGVFIGYCRDLAVRRFTQGYSASELAGAVKELGWICQRTLAEDEDAKDIAHTLYSQVMTTINFGCDEIHETFERLQTREPRGSSSSGSGDEPRELRVP